MILPYFAIVVLLLATAYSAIVSFRQAPKSAEANWAFPSAAGQRSRITIGFATLLVVLAFVAWFGLSVRHTIRRSSRFLIPDRYRGWVKVEFEVQGAPPLPLEGGQYVLTIGPDGSLKTSSLEQYGWADDSYFFYSPAGVHQIPDAGPRSLIWGKINGEAANSTGKRKYEEFFVGTQEEFKAQPNGEKGTHP